MSLDLRTALAIAFNAVLLFTCACAFIRGGRPEWIGAIANLLGSILTAGVHMATPKAWAPMHAVIFAIDVGVTATFFWLAVRTSRFWPIWAFGFGLADILMALGGGLLARVPLFAYQTGLGIYAYLALGALLLGTWRLPSNASLSERRGVRHDAEETGPKS
jgi:hypothetical protein